MDKGSKVLIVTCFQYPHTGGLSRGIKNEIKYFENKNYNVKVISSTSNTLRSENNTSIYVPKYLKGFLYRFLFALKSVSLLNNIKKQSKIYFIDCHDIFSYLSVFLSGMGSLSILTLHSIQSEDIFTMSSLCKKNPIYFLIFTIEFILNYLLEILVFNLANNIICVSEYEYNDTIKKRILKNSKNVSIIRNGTHAESFISNASSKDKIKKQLGINSDEKVVMFLGRFVPKNSPMLILQAINELDNKNIKVKYVFVGDGELKVEMKKYVNANNLNEKVIFTGAVPSENILCIADIFVSHCSSLVDGPGRTTFESMLLGIPVITGKDYIKENIFSANEICLVDKDNHHEISKKISQLLTDDNLRLNLGLNAKQKAVKEFTIDSQMTRLEQIMNTL